MGMSREFGQQSGVLRIFTQESGRPEHEDMATPSEQDDSGNGVPRFMTVRAIVDGYLQTEEL
jgi:hypothetical protein